MISGSLDRPAEVGAGVAAAIGAASVCLVIAAVVWSVGAAGAPPAEVLPALLRSIVLGTAATAVVVPWGFGTALWLSLYAPQRARLPLRVAFTALSDMPPVVMALLGVAALGEGVHAWWAALGLLVLLALPVIVRRTTSVLGTRWQRELDAAKALGATPVQIVRRVLLPRVGRRLVATTLFGALRVIADTMVVMLVLDEVVLTSLTARGGPEAAWGAGVLLALGAGLHVIGLRLWRQR